MSFAESLNFTNAGREVQLKALAGEQLIFTSVRLGDGTMTGTISAKTALINERASVNVNTVSANSEYATIDAIFKNSDLSSGFYWKELGVFVANPDAPNDRNADILYAYQNVGELAEYIPAPSSASIEKIIHIPVFIGDVDTVSIAVNSIVQQEATVTQQEEKSISEEDYISFYDLSDLKNKKISFNDLKNIVNTIPVEDISSDFGTISEELLSEDINVIITAHKKGNSIFGSVLIAGKIPSKGYLTETVELLKINDKYQPTKADMTALPCIAYKNGGINLEIISQAVSYSMLGKMYLQWANPGAEYASILISFSYVI